MTTTMETNGKLRKSLSDQIDRLDGILDGLAAALNDSVAAAVKEAVGLAVRDAVQSVLTQVLTNPELLARLSGLTAAPQPQVAAAQPAHQPVTARLAMAVRGVGGWIGGRIRAAGQLCRRGIACVGTGVTTCWARLGLLRQFKLQLLTAACVGVVAGAAAYHAAPWLASVASGVGGFAATLAVHTVLWLQRVVARTGLLEV
jgi:hypothetical protein